jgi:hypothetical protein
MWETIKAQSSKFKVQGTEQCGRRGEIFGSWSLELLLNFEL